MMGPKRCLSIKEKEVMKKKPPETNVSKTTGIKHTSLKEASLKKTSTPGNISNLRQGPENSTTNKQVQPNSGRSSVRIKPRQESESVKNIAKSTRSLSTYVSKTQVSKEVSSANSMRSTSNFIVSNYNRSVKKVSDTSKSVSKKSVKSKLFTQYSLPPVHPVAFIKDESKLFKEKIQSEQQNSLDLTMTAEKDEKHGITSVSQNENIEVINLSPRLSDQIVINSTTSVGMDLNKQLNINSPIIEVKSEIPEKELGGSGKIQVSTKIIVTTEIESSMDSKRDMSISYGNGSKLDDICKCESITDERVLSDSGDQNKAKFKPELQFQCKHEIFQTLDDLNIENLEAYISRCKGEKALTPLNDDHDISSYNNEKTLKPDSGNHDDSRYEKGVKPRNETLDLSQGEKALTPRKENHDIPRYVDKKETPRYEDHVIASYKGEKAPVSLDEGHNGISKSPVLDPDVPKPIINSYLQNEIKYEREGGLKVENAQFQESERKKESPREHEYQRKELEIIQTGTKNQDEEHNSDREKCDSETLIKIQSSAFDILEINVQMAKKENSEGNRDTNIDQNDNCIDDGTENRSVITNDSDKKTFVWTPSKMSCFRKSVENKSFVAMSNKSQNDPLVSVVSGLTNSLKEVKNEITAQLNITETKEKHINYSVGNVERINETVIKRQIAEYNVNCVIGNRITKDLIVSTKDQTESVHFGHTDNEVFNDHLDVEDDLLDDIDTLEILDLNNDCDVEDEGADVQQIIVCGFLPEDPPSPEQTDDPGFLQFSCRSSKDEFSLESEIVKDTEFLPKECVWIDYKSPIIKLNQNDYNENTIDNWIVEDEMDEQEGSNTIDSIILIDADSSDWIKNAERDFEELRTCLEECDAQAENAAKEIKTLRNKNSQKMTCDNRCRHNRGSKHSLKKKCINTFNKDDISDKTHVTSHLTERQSAGDYEPRNVYKTSDNSSAIIEEDIDYYSVSSSDEELSRDRKRVNVEPEKSYLSFGKSCVNARKKKDKRLSFFNLFKL